MNQQKRRIGVGMKPRGENLPTTEGQEVPPSEGVEETSSVTVEGGDLESVSAVEVEPEAERVVEETAGLHETSIPEVPQEAFDALAAAMKASEEQTGAEPQFPQFTVKPIPGRQFADILEPGPSEEELARSIYYEGKSDPAVQNLDPIAAFQKSYEEIKFPDPPSHMHVMGVDLARGDDKTVASVTDEAGNVRILSEAEMDAFVEKAKDAFTAEIEGEQPVGFQVFTKNGTPLTGIISQEELKQFIAPPMLVVDKIDLEEFAKLDMYPGARISYTPRQPEMGQLESGEYRHTVRIAESYVEGAKQQAEADNMDLEGWLSLQLNTYLEQYWWANGPK